jgi:hypothetical protein
MTQLEIKQRIDTINKTIESLFTPNVFTLNNTVADLLKEYDELKAQCVHSYVDGYCEYCYQEEPKA